MQEALDWIESETGRRVIRTKRLRGGLTSDVHAVALSGGETLVLRRYTEWGKEAADCVEREAATLEKLVGTDLPAPRLVAAEPAGDVPMLLMTRLPGRVWLTPNDTDAWLEQMARTLAHVHATPIDGASAESRTIDPKHVDIPVWTARRELWERIASILAAPPESFSPVFLHSDYQHFNMLWSRGRLTGLVDWVFSSPGHPDYDVAHCRLNLAVLFSIDVAERFRALYEAESGRRVEPWWDLRGLTSYGQGWKKFIPIQVAGRAVVDTAGMDDRIEGLMQLIIRRM